MPKTKFKVTVAIAVLFLLTSAAFIQVNYVGAQTSSPPKPSLLQADYGDFTVAQHQMSAAELQEYKDSVGTRQEGQNYNRLVAGHGTGLSPPSASEWGDIAQNAYVVDSVGYDAPLPDSVDLSESAWFPPIGDQGNQGSCSFFADVYYTKSYQEAKEHQWNLSQATWVGAGGSDNGHVIDEYQNRVMSPSFVYHLLNNGTHIGASLEAPIMIMCSIGVSSWRNMPYDQTDISSWPSEAAWTQAPYYRSNSTFLYQYIYANQTNGIANLKNWLAAGNVAVVALDAYDNLNPIRSNISQDLFTLDNYVNGPLDHAQTIVGYNDSITYTENGTLHSGAFKIVNSWGIGGGWENVNDGCYWMSYGVIAELSEAKSPVVLSQDLVGYQPEILATFNINHPARSDCNITFGLGTPSNPVVTKLFDKVFSEGDFYFGGKLPFPANNIIIDLTEFKSHMTCLYNQQFFMQVYDGGSGANGTVNYFAIGNTTSPQAPTPTIRGTTVNLTLTKSFAEPTFDVSPTSGPPSADITLNGVGFTGSPVDISYLNPETQSWVPIVQNLAISSMNFTYNTHAPDLRGNNLSGDNPPASDSIVFRVHDSGSDNTYNSTVPFSEFRRGLTQVGNQSPLGLFGNNTDLATAVFVENGQSIAVAGEWFSPGAASIIWDTTKIGTATVSQTGSFNAAVTVPTATAGKHTLTVDDGASNLTVTVTRLPKVSDDYVDVWYTRSFAINITADYTGTQTHYRVNSGETLTVEANGQPTIATEGSANTLEYWTTWDIYGGGNMELVHRTITAIKLDKTAPAAALWINGGATTTTSRTANLTVSAVDLVSGVKQMRFSNDAAWSQAVWEPYAASKSWELTSGAGAKTVYCQIQDSAGLTTTVNAQITFEAAQSTPSPTPSPTPTIPELPIALLLILLPLAGVVLMIVRKSGYAGAGLPSK